MVLLVCAEVPIGIAVLPDLLALQCVRVGLWRPNRLRPASDTDRGADRRLRYLWISRARRPGRVRQGALRQRGRRRQESQNGSDTQRAHQ